MITSTLEKDKIYMLGRSYSIKRVAQPAEQTFPLSLTHYSNTSLRHTHSQGNSIYVIGSKLIDLVPLITRSRVIDSSTQTHLSSIGTLPHPLTHYLNRTVIVVPGDQNIMKPLREKRVRRDAIRKCWKLYDQINITAAEVREANQPADLYSPQGRLIELSRLVRDYRMEWLEKRLNLDRQDRGSWPRL